MSTNILQLILHYAQISFQNTRIYSWHKQLEEINHQEHKLLACSVVTKASSHQLPARSWRSRAGVLAPHFTALWPWVNYFTSPSLSFLYHMNSPWFTLNVKQMLLSININYESLWEGEIAFCWRSMWYSHSTEQLAELFDEAIFFILLIDSVLTQYQKGQCSIDSRRRSSYSWTLTFKSKSLLPRSPSQMSLLNTNEQPAFREDQKDINHWREKFLGVKYSLLKSLHVL